MTKVPLPKKKPQTEFSFSGIITKAAHKMFGNKIYIVQYINIYFCMVPLISFIYILYTICISFFEYGIVGRIGIVIWFYVLFCWRLCRCCVADAAIKLYAFSYKYK